MLCSEDKTKYCAKCVRISSHQVDSVISCSHISLTYVSADMLNVQCSAQLDNLSICFACDSSLLFKKKDPNEK